SHSFIESRRNIMSNATQQKQQVQQVLAGKVAFIQGGSRGIGAAIARRLARDGAAVALTYMSSPDKAQQVVKEIVDAGGRALAIQADSSTPDAIRTAIDQAAATFGRIDILVNNAGVLALGAVEELT